MISGRPTPSLQAARRERGSVLIIVLWVCFGLAALVLYFAQSTSAELRSSDNRAVTISAEAAVDGGARYVQYVLSRYATNGSRPFSTDYSAEDVPVGDASFWLIGRDPDRPYSDEPVFNLVDESSKLNLNTATRSMLEALPGMTIELAAAIIDWRDSNFEPTENGAEDETYARLDPPRLVKNARFESVDELRLVYGATLRILLGEDANRNGSLDPNEDDGDATTPFDDRDGVLAPGILEYVTVWSSQPRTRSDGSPRINVQQPNQRQRLAQLLSSKLGDSRAQAILGAVGEAAVTSVAEFMLRGQFTAAEFQQIHTDITGNDTTGLINVNTAPEAVLACIPGFDWEKARAITAYRSAHTDTLTSFAWLPEVLDRATIIRAGRYLTDQSYQFSADIVGTGPHGRGYSRAKFVFDTSKTSPRILYRQDLTSSGWALGATWRDQLRFALYASR